MWQLFLQNVIIWYSVEMDKFHPKMAFLVEDLPKLLKTKKAGSHEKPVAIRVICLKSVVTKMIFCFFFVPGFFKRCKEQKRMLKKEKQRQMAKNQKKERDWAVKTKSQG